MKSIDNSEKNSLKDLFATKEQEARKVGETYKQYGFRVAGITQGSQHSLSPCLQSVCLSIKREQEHNAALQEQLRNDLLNKKTKLEADLKNKNYEIEASQDQQKALSSEIDELKEDLSDLKHGTNERNRKAWITLIISSVLLVPFSIYFFIFYSSVGYSAFFKQFDFGNIANGNFVLSQAIFDAQAIPNAWNDGFAELMFILFMPFVFLAFGFVLNRWERETGWLKYVKIPLLITVAFLFDTLLSYEICKKIYDLNAMMQLGDIEPYSFKLAIVDPSFWIIICLGFVSYLIWGFVFGFWVKAWESLDLKAEKRKRLEEKIADTKNRLETENKNCLKLKTEANNIDANIKEIEAKIGVTIRYDIAEIVLEMNNFFAGWQAYLAAAGKSNDEKEKSTNIFNDMIDSIKVE